ncbi:MAG: tetratricopeptide repeat protein [Planctomycetota bacterium]
MLPGQDAAALVQEGRTLLEAGKAQEALALFEKADKAAGQDPDVHIWVLRAWIDLGRVNDALRAAETMRDKDKVDTAGLDYLIGMASFQQARNLMDGGGNPTDALGTATGYLQSALGRDEKTYADAYATLAHSLWYQQELGLALDAINKAVQYRPQSAKVRTIEGEVHFSLYVDERNRADEGAEVPKEHASAALAAFSRAAELTGKGASEAALQAAIWSRIGDVHLWLKDLTKASEAYAESIAWAPGRADFGGALWRNLVREGKMDLYNETLAKGLENYLKRNGEKGPEAATILWWLGYGQMSAGQHKEGEKSFLESVERNRSFANSWYYVGLCRYYQKDYEGALDGWLAYRDIDAASLATTIRADEANQVPIVAYAARTVIQGAPNADQIRKVEAITAVLTHVQPQNSEFWNNLGLLRRDLGESIWRTKQETDPEQVRAIYQGSWDAYDRAVKLVPEDPGYLNDAAVILQYYLGTDIEKARAYYEKAAESAAAMIAAESWKEQPEAKQADEETRIRTALRDSKDNLKKLDKGEIGTRGPKAKAAGKN